MFWHVLICKCFYLAGESNRWLHLYEVDPVNSLRLSEFFRGQLQAGAAAHGPGFTAALHQLDPSLQAQLKPIVGG